MKPTDTSIATWEAMMTFARSADWEQIDFQLEDSSPDDAEKMWLEGSRIILSSLAVHTDPNVRDLSASVMEKVPNAIDDTDVLNLAELLEIGFDDRENQYPAFRAACALANVLLFEKRKIPVDSMKAVLLHFLEDKDPVVQEIAAYYLQQLHE